MGKRKNRNIHIPGDPPKGPSLLIDILLLFIVPPFTTIAGIYLLIKRGHRELTRMKLNDYRHYAAIIGDRSSVSIRELANRLGKSTDDVIAGLRDMIDQNMIDSGAYIDRSTLMLHLDDDVIETEFVRPTVNIYVDRQADEAKKQAVETTFVNEESRDANSVRLEKPEAQTARPEQSRPRAQKPPADTDDFEAKLREIRTLNDSIENEVVSQRIDRIGALTASIFRVVREKPERAEEVRKFMNYYLPTTLKLLKSYSLMEKQSYQGENIQASRRKIEDVLGSLVHAFEQMQDNLFKSEALDVETDISVLETMMASDGFTERGGLHL